MLKRLLLLLIVLTCLLPGSGWAQKRRPAPKPKPKPAAPAPSDLRAEAAQVAEQLKILARFVYLYGRVSNGFEVAEEQAKKGPLSPSIVEKNNQNKASVVNGIAGLKVGLDKVEQTLKANPRLQVQYVNLLSVSELVIQARDLAANNQYDAAGRSLTKATEKLADLLVEIR